jgi:hypothetical protein
MARFERSGIVSVLRRKSSSSPRTLDIAVRSAVQTVRLELRELAGAASYYVSGNDIKLQLELDNVAGDPCTDSCTQGLIQLQMSL